MTPANQMTREKIEALVLRLFAGAIARNECLQLMRTHGGPLLTEYQVRVHNTDVGRILGKEGKRFGAFRQIMAAAGEQIGHEMKLTRMADPVPGKAERFPPYSFNPRWPREQIKQLLKEVCDACLLSNCNVSVIQNESSAIMEIGGLTASERRSLASLAPALQNIFGGLGTTNGCHLSIDVKE